MGRNKTRHQVMERIRFNPALLLTARQYRGLSQAAISELTGINQGYYSRIENNLLPDDPAEDSVKAISKALDFPKSFFYQDDPIMGLPISVHPMYRKSSSVGEKALSKLNAELNIRSLQLRRLLNAVDIEPKLELPKLDVDDSGGAEKVAEIIRRTWMLPKGAINNLTELVEMAGCVVVWCNFDAPVDGVTFKFSDLPHCIFLNKSAPPDRMRFSLAHELGHIIMHRIPTDNIEDEANLFASELLMPEKDIRRHLSGGLTIEKLVRLKLTWKVSMQALMYKAKQIDAITQNQYSYLNRIFSSRGWKTREPEDTDFAYEQPTLSTEIIKLHVDDLGYTEDELTNMLHLNMNDLHSFYGNIIFPKRKPNLRVVI